MIWELIATVCAGVGAAGIALLLIKLSRQRLPRYLTPIFAGIAMLAFQIYNEYQWFNHQKSLLPEGVEVVMTASDQKAWQPWTYLIPQTNRFMAADFANTSVNQLNPDIVMLDLYLFAQRSPAIPVKQLIHCKAGKRADFSVDMMIPTKDATLDDTWFDIPADTDLLKACQR